MKSKLVLFIIFANLFITQNVYSQELNKQLYAGTNSLNKLDFRPDTTFQTDLGYKTVQTSYNKEAQRENSLKDTEISNSYETVTSSKEYDKDLGLYTTYKTDSSDIKTNSKANETKVNENLLEDNLSNYSLSYKSGDYTEINPDASINNDNDIEEGSSDSEELSPLDQGTSKPIEGQISMEIKTFDINESVILSDEEINNITRSYIGKPISIEILQQVVNSINDLYREKGFITAKAYLPSQKVENGVVKISLVEGKVGSVIVEGNKWTKTAYILDRMSQKPDRIFELQALEKDITTFNRNNTVKLRANIKPGKDFGTSDIYLIANDPQPFHFVPSFDNTGRETIGVLRGGVSFQSDSLLGYRDQFSMGYSRARSTDIAYSSYTLPVGKYGTKIGGSFAFSNIKITSGPFKDLNIEGNSYNYSGFVSHPFISTRKFDFSGDLGVNFRQVTTFFDETPLFTTQIRSLVVGLNFQYRDKWGYWSSRHSATNGLDLLGGNARFFKYNGYVTRVHNFGHGIIGIFRAACQLTDDRLPPVEQFQIGGSSTVRGYSEGLLIGDNGYLFSGELRVPLPFLPKKIGNLDIRDRIRGVVFVDHAGAFPDDGQTSQPHHTDYLTSVGLGLRGSITRFISGRIDWGFGLGRRENPQPTARMHFGLESNPI
ncbi:MAG: ShlB/FhaC/HecB family hemolysin secretion/activation protein [Cyanobacteriota bacterium]